MSWVWRIAVQLLDMVPNRGAYFVGKSEEVEWRSSWIEVFCDRHLSDELAFPDMQEEKRRCCGGDSCQLGKVPNGDKSNYPTSLAVWELTGVHELLVGRSRKARRVATATLWGARNRPPEVNSICKNP